VRFHIENYITLLYFLLNVNKATSIDSYLLVVRISTRATLPLRPVTSSGKAGGLILQTAQDSLQK